MEISNEWVISKSCLDNNLTNNKPMKAGIGRKSSFLIIFFCTFAYMMNCSIFTKFNDPNDGRCCGYIGYFCV